MLQRNCSKCLDNRLTDGGEVVGLTRQSAEDSWYSFLFEAELHQGYSAAARLGSIDKSNYLIGNRTRDLQVRRIGGNIKHFLYTI
jgi:hypothetical protein